MIAFLKRQWGVLLCVVVLATLTMFDVPLMKSGPVAFTVFRGDILFGVGHFENLDYYSRGVLTGWDETLPQDEDKVHTPMFGRGPSHHSQGSARLVLFPLWILLAAMSGLMMFREITWYVKHQEPGSVRRDTIDFLKRRWAALSCVVLLFALSFVDLQTRLKPLTVEYGELRWHYWGQDLFSPEPTRVEFHELAFRALPEVQISRSFASIDLELPLWIPFAAAIGWITLAELRWREKRPADSPVAT